jgi:hypothetical protein
MSDNPALANLKSQVSHKVCDLVLQHAQSLRTRSGWKRNRPPKAMGIARYLALAILSAELVGVDAFAGSGSTTLIAGETLTIRTSVVYRDIKVCNDSASQGDLLAAFGSNEPVRLAPGMCQWDRGDRITLRNDSAATIASAYRVSTCSEPRGH